MNIEHGKSEQYQHQSDGNTPSKNEGVDNCTLCLCDSQVLQILIETIYQLYNELMMKEINNCLCALFVFVNWLVGFCSFQLMRKF